MAQPILDTARLHELLHYDPLTGKFAHLRAYLNKPSGRPADLIATAGYFRVCIDQQQYLSHRLAWFYVHGAWPEMTIDHINGVRTDNRISNLRMADRQTQRENLHVGRNLSASGLLGVSLKKNGRFEAQIASKGQRFCLGTFGTPEEAHEAYLQAKRLVHAGCTI